MFPSTPWRHLFRLILAIVPACTTLQAQTHWCASGHNEPRHAAQARAQMDQHIRQLTQNPTNRVTGGEQFTIPVVIHIIHNGGPEDITDQQATHAIDQLNDIFANRGDFEQPDGNDIGVTFCIAQVDENGRPATGIQHYRDSIYTDLGPTDDEGIMKMRYGWPTDQYLNIYVVQSIGVATAYATLPNGDEFDPTDGIVIKHTVMGAQDSSAGVLAHEVGHYLGLYHTFQGGCRNYDCLLSGDMICDTPPDSTQTMFEGCTSPNNNCSTDADASNPENPFTTDQPDLHENLMDYNTFACMRAFTAGQRTRMRIVMHAYRPRLTSSARCLIPTNIEVAAIELFPTPALTCDSTLSFQVNILNNSAAYLQSLQVHTILDGVPLPTIEWYGTETPGGYRWIDLPTRTLLSPGTHRITVHTALPNAQPDPFPANDSISHTFHVPHSARLPYIIDFEQGMPTDAGLHNSTLSHWERIPLPGCEAIDNHGLTLEPSPLGTFQGGIIFPWLDLTGHTNPKLTFLHAYKRSGGFSLLQHLTVFVQRDCDLSSAEQIYFKSQNQLTSAFNHDKSITWRPTECGDWRHEEIDLSAYEGQRILLHITSTIGRENYERLHLDDIRVESDQTEGYATFGIPDEAILVYPSPSDGNFNVSFPSVVEQTVKLELFNSIGQRVHTLDHAAGWGQQDIPLHLEGLATGIYTLRLHLHGQNPVHRKLLIVYQ